MLLGKPSLRVIHHFLGKLTILFTISVIKYPKSALLPHNFANSSIGAQNEKILGLPNKIRLFSECRLKFPPSLLSCIDNKKRGKKRNPKKANHLKRWDAKLWPNPPHSWRRYGRRVAGRTQYFPEDAHRTRLKLEKLF